MEINLSELERSKGRRNCVRRNFSSGPDESLCRWKSTRATKGGARKCYSGCNLVYRAIKSNLLARLIAHVACSRL